MGSATDANVDIEMPPGHVVGGMSGEAPKRPMEHPIPTLNSIPSYARIGNLFVHHVFPSSNCPLHKHVLSFPKVRLLLFH